MPSHMCGIGDNLEPRGDKFFTILCREGPGGGLVNLMGKI